MSDLLCICRQIFVELEEIIYRNSYFDILLAVWNVSALEEANLFPARLQDQIRYLQVRFLFQTLLSESTVEEVREGCGASLELLKEKFVSLERLEVSLVCYNPRETVQQRKRTAEAVLRAVAMDFNGLVKIAI